MHLNRFLLVLYRVFCFQVAADNLLEGAFEARRLICDYVHDKGGVCNVEITPKLLVAAAGARQQYLHYLKEQERTRKKQETKSRKRKLEDELEGEKQKKKCLLQDISSMEKSANHLAQQAEDTRKVTLIAQSNSMRRGADKKKEELASTEKRIDEILQQMKKC